MGLETRKIRASSDYANSTFSTKNPLVEREKERVAAQRSCRISFSQSRRRTREDTRMHTRVKHIRMHRGHVCPCARLQASDLHVRRLFSAGNLERGSSCRRAREDVEKGRGGGRGGGKKEEGWTKKVDRAGRAERREEGAGRGQTDGREVQRTLPRPACPHRARNCNCNSRVAAVVVVVVAASRAGTGKR